MVWKRFSRCWPELYIFIAISCWFHCISNLVLIKSYASINRHSEIFYNGIIGKLSIGKSSFDYKTCSCFKLKWPSKLLIEIELEIFHICQIESFTFLFWHQNVIDQDVAVNIYIGPESFYTRTHIENENLIFYRMKYHDNV